jgi:hypothetical protein
LNAYGRLIDRLLRLVLPGLTGLLRAGTAARRRVLGKCEVRGGQTQREQKGNAAK